MLMESQVKFRPQIISGASQQNSIAAAGEFKIISWLYTARQLWSESEDMLTLLA